MDDTGDRAISFSEAERKATKLYFGAKESKQYNNAMCGYIIVPDEIFEDLKSSVNFLV